VMGSGRCAVGVLAPGKGRGGCSAACHARRIPLSLQHYKSLLPAPAPPPLLHPLFPSSTTRLPMLLSQFPYPSTFLSIHSECMRL
jgi:hypothetical protein